MLDGRDFRICYGFCVLLSQTLHTMGSIQKQTDYWIKGASQDIDTAELLIREKHFLHGLFFCHLVLEKAIKAHYVKNNKQSAPKSHNLIYLSENTGLSFTEETMVFFGILMRYQLEGRYPDYNPFIPDEAVINNYLSTTKEILQWLKEKL